MGTEINITNPQTITLNKNTRVRATSVIHTQVYNNVALENDEVTTLPAVSVSAPYWSTLYLNNSNVPIIAGYDFVMAIPNNFVVRNSVPLKLYYISNTVANRTQTSWTTSSTSSLTGDASKTKTLNTYGATNMNSMFKSNTSITSAPKLNTQNVNNMGYMFYGCTSLETIPEYDTIKVTNMEYMLSRTKIKNIPSFKTSLVTNMKGMFEGNTSVVAIPEVFDTSSVTNTSYFCNGCTSLTTVGTLDLRKVSTMFRMFNGCTQLKNIIKIIFSEVSNSSAEEAFSGCTSLTSLEPFLNSNGWLDLGALYNTTNMFKNCTNLVADGICIDMKYVYFCQDMFVNTKVKNIKLYNVRNADDVANIGCTYTVMSTISS